MRAEQDSSTSSTSTPSESDSDGSSGSAKPSTAARVVLMSGTDEHGNKVRDCAVGGSLSPLHHCDALSYSFQREFAQLGVQPDDWLRTTQPRHEKTVHAMWNKLQRGGHIYKGKHEGWYSKADEAFVPEARTRRLENAVGEGKAGGGGEGGAECRVDAERGQPLEWVSEENYKFKLSAFREPLLKWLLKNPTCIVPKTKWAEVVRELQATNKAEWGVAVPGDDSHTVYVWLDALSVYLTAAHSAAGHSATDHTRSCMGGDLSAVPSASIAPAAGHWPPALQVIGKDIVRFHCIYWPAFLMAAGLALPERIYVHGHWTVNGMKMSKSLGNVVGMSELSRTFGTAEGALSSRPSSAVVGDPIRYLLLHLGPSVEDANYSENDAVNRLNADICDQLGNLLSRVTAPAMCPGGVAPPLPAADSLDDADLVMLEMCFELSSSVQRLCDQLRFREGINAVMDVVRAANTYFHAKEPWLARKLPDGAGLPIVDRTVAVCAEVLRTAGVLLQHVMPVLSHRLLDAIGADPGNAARSLAAAALPSSSSSSSSLPHFGVQSDTQFSQVTQQVEIAQDMPSRQQRAVQGLARLRPGRSIFKIKLAEKFKSQPLPVATPKPKQSKSKQAKKKKSKKKNTGQPQQQQQRQQ